ncbi:hypothetical protein [Streptomyces sp. NBC_00344]|uniref:hypothetical protein n=1 Tax=Streptomyces sp. NBC_00344 TaxID=2975720 RepID=UPI002E1AEB3A
MLLPAALGLGGCAAEPSPPRLKPDDVVNSAQQLLTDRCLTRLGLTPPRPGQRPPSKAEGRRVTDALFGAGHTELTLTLPTGYVVRAHSDGCLAAAQRTLYGDQRRWFRASTIVNNLRPEARYRGRSLAAVRELHRTEVAEVARLRARALHQAITLLSQQRQKENHPT